LIELPANIEAELRNGLRPQTFGRAKVNSPYLLDLAGLRVGQLGLEPSVLPKDPFGGLKSVDWPFPQLFRGDDVSLLATRDKIHTVSEGSGVWTTTSLSLSDTSSPSTTKSVTEGGVWHHADMGGSWYLFNGNCTVFVTGIDSLIPQAAKYWINDSVTIKTGCKHQNRVVIGGLGSNIFSEHMSNIFRKIQMHAADDWITSFDDIGQNYILWGSVGGGDFPLWLFMPTQYPAPFKPTYEKFIERLKRNQFGWAPCTFRGTVQVVKSLGRHLIAYGTDGVTAFTHISGEGDVPATYGANSPALPIMSGLGIYDRGAVAGNDQIHYWIDPTGKMWSLNANLELEERGYEEYFSEATERGETFVGTYDPIEGDFYFSTEERGFLLTASGLSRSLYRFPNFTSWGGKRYAVEKADGNLSGKYAVLETNAFDLRDRSRKTITAVNLGYRGGGTVEVALRYKNSASGSWNMTHWVPVSPEGNAAIRVQALEHRVMVRASDPTTFELEYITPKVQRDDRRWRRGPTEGTRVARDVG
jgi:hypothetical protein